MIQGPDDLINGMIKKNKTFCMMRRNKIFNQVGHMAVHLL